MLLFTVINIALFLSVIFTVDLTSPSFSLLSSPLTSSRIEQSSTSPSFSLLSSPLTSSRIDEEECVSLVWTIEQVSKEVNITLSEVSTESACEELSVVNGVIQPAAALLVIF
jgi:hypothetical protein